MSVDYVTVASITYANSYGNKTPNADWPVIYGYLHHIYKSFDTKS